MIKLALPALLLLVSTQSQAFNDYFCVDAKTGSDAGKISVEASPANGKREVIYSNLQSSNDGWSLTLTREGQLFNDDEMVQSGRRVHVGSVKGNGSRLLVDINARKMICEPAREYFCVDAQTRSDAGKLSVDPSPRVDGKREVTYSNMRSSSDGWSLTLTREGQLYNDDSMVQFGRAQYVGSIKGNASRLLVDINARKMVCQPASRN